MKRRDYWFLVILVVISGLIGGAVSNWLFVSKAVYAQQPYLQLPDSLGLGSTKGRFKKFRKKGQEVVIAQEFRLVDENGQVKGRLYVDDKGHGQLEIHPFARSLAR